MSARTLCTPLAILVTLMLFASFLATTGCEKASESVVGAPPPQPKWLTIVTPHNEKIRRAFQHNFAAWYVENRGTSVYFDWIVRGTPECLAYIADVARTNTIDMPQRPPDLIFGGGIADHVLLAERGQAVPIEIDDALADIPPKVGGLPTRDADGHWHATGLSSFGILYNQTACEQRGIQPPTAWKDLADPRFQSWVAMASPLYSGSTRECLLLILQHEGWQQGWATILRILGNTRALVDSSSCALGEVGNGVCLATFAVNFDGQAEAAENDGKLVYINPPQQTAVNPSAVSVLTTSSDIELSRDFVRFCLSEEGQKLWGVKAEHRGGIGETLYHYPISPKLYEKYAGQLALNENPFETQFGLKIDAERRSKSAAVLLPLVQAACRGNHVLLQQTWDAIVQADLHEAALAELTAPPFDEQTAYELGAAYQAADAEAAAKMLAEWSAMFRDKYEKALALARG